MLETWLVSIVLVCIVVYIIFDWRRLSKDLYRCPKCNANGQDIKKLGKEDLGTSIHNKNVINFRSIYACKKCSHTWTLGISIHKKKKY